MRSSWAVSRRIPVVALVCLSAGACELEIASSGKTMPQQEEATFVGRGVCAGCHTGAGAMGTLGPRPCHAGGG